MKLLPGKIGTIRKELEGKACSSCGSNRYQVILRCGVEVRRDSLYVQCRRCFTRTDLEEMGMGVDRLATAMFLQYGPTPSLPSFPFWTPSSRVDN